MPTMIAGQSARACPAVWAMAGLLLLAGCSSTVQTTSGKDYLAARPAWAAAAAAGGERATVERAVHEAAQVEPLLRFPARIGIARIERQAITPIPPVEAEAWAELARGWGSAYGELVPISPLVAEMAAAHAGAEAVRSVVDRIRVGAARQHVDAVLTYEVVGSQEDTGSLLSVFDLTILGAWVVPSRRIAGHAVASALLIDVRNGYPYGTASAAADATGLSPNAGSGERSARLAAEAGAEAVRKLTAEVGAMMARLKGELEARELAELRAEKAAREAAERP